MVTFPGYEVSGQVAAGSTGIVWQARQVELDRMVAIKELSPALLQAPGFLERFRAEAQTLAALDDPHVVRIFDYVEEPSRAYLVQEWVDGAPLEAVLAQHGTLTPEQSLGVLRGGLIGLAHAHQRGLVHRDVSPANILLDRAGTSKLLDFGLAARTDQGLAPGAPASVGTPAFSSPEAVTGAPMTTQSDVYSAAAVLYLLLAGRLPYSGDVGQVLAAHANAPVPRLDGHGPELADLLARAMAKNPDQRPADAAAFLAELEDAATRRYGPAWLSRASVAGLVTATMAGTGVLTAAGTGAAAPTAQAVAYGAAATPTTLLGQTAATAGRTGRRILGMPVAAAITALVLVIAAIAATVIVVTSSDDDPSRTAVEQGAGDPEGTDSASSVPTSLPPVPAFEGTYDVTVTLLSYSGDIYDPEAVGTVVERVWEVTATCRSGPCDVTVASSSGSTLDFVYADGSWTFEGPSSLECVDSVTGVPTGETVPSTVVTVITPNAPVDPDGTTPIAALTGTSMETAPAPTCGGGAEVTFSRSLEVIRAGD
ncbi:MAG: serine/threonine protein kinase [Actinomycetota bacterium]|nr:serine/threonine protein kinase [Actinomycetota bacterium]